MPRQGKEVFRAIPQRRDVELQHVQAKIQVLPEAALLDLLPEIVVRRRDHADIHLYRLPAAPQALELVLLHHAQDLGLGRRAHVPDLVEEDRPLVGLLELPDPQPVRSRERSPLVPEQLALQQVLVQGGAIDLHQRLLPPRALEVDQAGEDLFPRPGLPGDQHGRMRGRHLPYGREDLLHRRVLRDDPDVVHRHPVLGPLEELQFPAHLPQAGGGIHAVLQVFQVERFLDVIEGAKAQRLDGGIQRGVRRHQDHFRLGVDLLGLPQHVDAADIPQLDVGDDDVDRVGFQNLDRLRPVGGAEDLIPRILEEGHNPHAEGFVVLNDQDAIRHAPVSPGAS